MSGGGEGDIGKYPSYITLLLILCVIAVLLNVLAVYFVIKFGKYRASTDIFLTNLAVSDVLHAAIVTPLHLKSSTSDQEDFYGDTFTCKFVMFIPLFTSMSAIFTMVAMAIDRYRCVVQKKQLYRRGAIFTIVLIWIASICFSAPQIYEYNIYNSYSDDNNHTACGSEGIVEHFETIYATFAFCCGYLIPLVIIIACYTRVVVSVWKHGKRFRNTTMRAHSDEDVRQNSVPTTDRMNNMVSTRIIKLLKMLISLTGLFVLLWTPYFMLFALTEITGLDDSSKFEEWPHVASRLMTVLSTISNPVLYLAFCEKFREILNKTICRICCLGKICSNRVVPSNSQHANSTHTSATNIPVQFQSSGPM